MHRTIIGLRGGPLPPADVRRTERTDYGPKLRGVLDEGRAISESTYHAALDHQQALRACKWLRPGRTVDAWLMPATNTAAPPLDSTGDPRFNSPWSYAGLPAVTLPCGLAASQWHRRSACSSSGSRMRDAAAAGSCRLVRATDWVCEKPRL